MKVGYIRVSTIDQNDGRQVELFKGHGIEKVFTDKASGKDTNRPQLQLMIDFVRDGDSVYIESFSRLARSTKDLLELVEMFNAKGVQLVSLKENLNTSTPQGKLMVTMMGAIAEFERDCILERQREGIALAKAKGKYKGKKKLPYPINFGDIYHQWKQREITGTKAMEITGLKKATFYRMTQRYEQEQIYRCKI